MEAYSSFTLWHSLKYFDDTDKDEWNNSSTEWAKLRDTAAPQQFTASTFTT